MERGRALDDDAINLGHPRRWTLSVGGGGALLSSKGSTRGSAGVGVEYGDRDGSRLGAEVEDGFRGGH